MDDRLDKAISAIRKAAKRLQPEQGERARRNAREAMLTALRSARSVLDEQYPISITRKPRATTALGKKRLRTKFEREHGRIDSAQAATFQAEEIPVIRRKNPETGPLEPSHHWWVPSWVKQMMRTKVPTKVIAECARNWRKRKRILALKQLGHGS